MAVNDHKYNDIEQDEEMENEEYANEKEKRVRRQSLVKVVGGLLLFGGGMVVGAASDVMLTDYASNNQNVRRVKAEGVFAASKMAKDWWHNHPDERKQAMKFAKDHEEEIKKFHGGVVEFFHQNFHHHRHTDSHDGTG